MSDVLTRMHSKLVAGGDDCGFVADISSWCTRRWTNRVYSYHGGRPCKRTSTNVQNDSFAGEQTVTDTEIHVPDGIRSSNKCRWAMMAVARADAASGTALGERLVGE
jgi:hypothetical protein